MHCSACDIERVSAGRAVFCFPVFVLGVELAKHEFFDGKVDRPSVEVRFREGDAGVCRRTVGKHVFDFPGVSPPAETNGDFGDAEVGQPGEQSFAQQP